MEEIDWPQIINWFVEGGIGFVFTFLGAYVAFRYALAKDQKNRAAEAALREQEKREKEEKEKDQLRRIQLVSGAIDQEALMGIFRLQSIINDLKREKR